MIIITTGLTAARQRAQELLHYSRRFYGNVRFRLFHWYSELYSHFCVVLLDNKSQVNYRRSHMWEFSNVTTLV